jgi:glycosyltransferase involved in cell wall biosynthesis
VVSGSGSKPQRRVSVGSSSLHEGLGVAALEAMAAARPVVASRVGGLAEVVVDGETGALVPPGDAEALARALGRLAADPSLRARLGAAGHARVVARHTMARMAEGTLACYEERP